MWTKRQQPTSGLTLSLEVRFVAVPHLTTRCWLLIENDNNEKSKEKNSRNQEKNQLSGIVDIRNQWIKIMSVKSDCWPQNNKTQKTSFSLNQPSPGIKIVLFFINV